MCRDMFATMCPSLLQMEMMMGDSRQSVAVLQSQLDDYKERSRKDLQEAQRNSKDRLVELQRAQNNLKAQQEEVRTEGFDINYFTPKNGQQVSTGWEISRQNLCLCSHVLWFPSSLSTWQVSRLKKELLTCSEERDSAQLERDLINNRFKHLENELEAEKSSQTDRSREIRGLEVRLQGQRS